MIEFVDRERLIFRRGAADEQVGAPALPQLRRHGFTVVEWGGADLDEPLTRPADR